MMYARTMRGWGTSLALVLAFGLVGCGLSEGAGEPSGEVAEGEEAIAEAAKDEGEVVFYCGIPETSCDAIGDAFMEKYPDVTATVSRMPSSEQTTRFLAERESNAPTADILISSDFPFMEDALQDGVLKPWDAILPDDYPEEYVVASVNSPYQVALNAMIYNTDLVSDDEVPSDYPDVLDHPDQWRGRVCTASPAASPSIAVMWGTLADVNGGDDFLRKANDLDIRWFEDGNAPVTAATAAGECDLQILGNVGRARDLQEEGAPLEVVYPPGVTGAPFTLALNSEPAHPNAQSLFATWMISPEASELLVELDPSTAVAYAEGEADDVTPPNFDHYQEANLDHIAELLGLEF